MSKKTLGRPTKLTPAMIDMLVEGMELGLPFVSLCKMADIADTTFYDWMERGEAGEEPFAGFHRRITGARERGQKALAAMIREAAQPGRTIKETRIRTLASGKQEVTEMVRDVPPDWRAAAWILERRFHELWGRKDTVDVKTNWKEEVERLGVDADDAVKQAMEALRELEKSNVGKLKSDAEVAGGERASKASEARTARKKVFGRAP